MVSGALKCPKKGSEFYFSGWEGLIAIESPPDQSTHMSLGIDDTDSARGGMCTTYVATEIARDLKSNLGVGFWDYPGLVRLNPQVPNKTRGNGALVLHLFADHSSGDDIIEIAEGVVSRYAVLDDDSTHPGMALMVGDPSRSLRDFHHRCLHRIVEKKEAWSWRVPRE